MSRGSCLIREVLIVPPYGSGKSPFYGWVAVRDGRIAEVGDGSLEGAGFGEIIEGNGSALIPGLVNTHAHSHSSLTRGSAEGLPLEGWLAVLEREQAKITEEEAYYGALATYSEALLSGTTAIVDMCLRPEAALAAAQEIGIRAVVAPYAADAKPFAPDLARTANLLERAANLDDRVRVWVGLHDLESCSDEQIRRGADLARTYGTGIHLHCSETRSSVAKTCARTGLTPIAQLARLGALGSRTLLAHCVWLDEEDRGRLRSAGAHVAHCPHANLKLGSGVAPIPALCASGVNVTLATDGAKANNRLDMFDVMKFASLLHKGVAEDPTLLPAGQILDMATRRAGVAIGAEVGAIAPGMAADLTMVRQDAFHLQPSTPGTVVTNLVHAARGSDVSMVMVDGRIVVRDGHLTFDRREAVLGKSQEIGLQLMARTTAVQ